MVFAQTIVSEKEHTISIMSLIVGVMKLPLQKIVVLRPVGYAVEWMAAIFLKPSSLSPCSCKG